VAHCLVTGGAGYIGSHAVRALLRAGHSVVVLDDLRGGRARFVGEAPLVRADVGDREAVARCLSAHGPFDAVLHFAALVAVAESVAEPLHYYETNVAGSRTLIEAALRHGVRAFVHSSSAAVYGAPERQPIPESSSLAPQSPYGASKAMVERMLADVERAHGLRHVALRYFNAAGADPAGGIGECHEPETHLIPLALEAAAGLRPELVLFGTDYPTRDGTCVRDYVHVSDLAEAHVLAVEALLAGGPGGAYNLGSGRGFTNREVLAEVERATGRPVPLREGPRRPGDPPMLVADPTRCRRELGFAPRRSRLDEIVASAWRWLREDRGL
jgi:UDP-glucose-4-epimerase GalE